MIDATSNEELFQSLGLARTPEQNKRENDASELGLQTFLKLMVTQLQNQNPFEPMENGDFLGQIAQFGTVSGLDKLNGSFDDLSSSLTSSQALQAGSLVGRDVLVPMSSARYVSGDTVRGRVDLDSSAGNVVVRITDQVGQLVKELQLGGSDQGTLEFTWDGLTDQGDYAPSGIYDIQVHAVRNGTTEGLEAQLLATVDSVTVDARRGLILNLEGLGSVAFDDVKQIH